MNAVARGAPVIRHYRGCGDARVAPPCPSTTSCVCVEKITLLYLTYLAKRIVYSWGSRRPVSRVTRRDRAGAFREWRVPSGYATPPTRGHASCVELCRSDAAQPLPQLAHFPTQIFIVLPKLARRQPQRCGSSPTAPAVRLLAERATRCACPASSAAAARGSPAAASTAISNAASVLACQRSERTVLLRPAG